MAQSPDFIPEEEAPDFIPEKGQEKSPVKQMGPLPTPAEDLRMYVSETISNIPGSALEAAKGIVQTGPALVGAAKAFYGPGGVTKTGKALLQYGKERFGHPARTLHDDPVGFAMDVSTIFSGLSGASKTLGKIGAGLDPVRLAAGTTGKAVEATARAGEAGAVRKYMRQLPELPAEEASKSLTTSVQAAERGIKEGVKLDTHPLVVNGIPRVDRPKIVQQVKDLERSLYGYRDQVFSQLEQAGVTIDKQGIADEALKFLVGGMYKRFPERAGKAQQLTEKFAKEPVTEIDPQTGKALQTSRTYYTAREAEEKKEALYKLRSKDYEKMTGPHRDVQENVDKAVAHALMERLNHEAPELSELNQSGAEMKLLRRSLEEFVERKLKKIPFTKHGIHYYATKAAYGTAGAALGAHGGYPDMALGMAGALALSGAINSPAIQSRLAIALHRASRLARQGGQMARKFPIQAITPLSRLAVGAEYLQENVQDIQGGQ